MEVLKILFIIMLLLFPLGELGRMQIGHGIAIKVNDMAVGFTIIFWVIYKLFFCKEKINFTNKISKHYLIFLGICIVSLVVNSTRFSINELIVSFFYFLRFIAYTTLLFVTVNFDKNFKKKIIFFMIAVGSVVVGIGYFQYIFYQDLHSLFYLGWDEHMYRLFSSFLDPNFAGAFLVLYLMLLLGRLLESLAKKTKKSFLFLGILSSITILGILLTYSRSAIIMMVVSASIFLILTKNKKWIFGVIGVLGIFFIFSSRNFNIENLNLLRVASSEARVETAQNAIDIILKNPFFGVGFNTYKYVQVQYGFRNVQNISTSHADGSTDNSFLFVLATTGVVGFVAYLWLWFTIVKNLFLIHKNKQSNGNHFVIVATIASIGGLFVDALFINSLFYPFLMEWIFILIGLSLQGNIKDYK